MTNRYDVPCVIVSALLFGFFLGACSSGGNDPVEPGDPMAPLAIDDLAVTAGSPGAITLNWTAPVLEDNSGAELIYELKFITLADVNTPVTGWAEAANLSSGSSGANQTHTVQGLDTDQTYAFILRTRTSSLPSPWSNITVGTAATNHDITPPAAVSRLNFWSSTNHSLTLTWEPSGDDGPFGQAHHYEVRYSSALITDQNWDEATPSSSAVVAAANGKDLQTTINDLDEDVEYFTAVRAVDDAGLVSSVSTNLAATIGQRRTWYIKEDGTGDAPTVEAGVDSSGAGDIVLVAPGHYTWTNQGTGDHYGLLLIPNLKSDFQLISEAGAEATILDAEGQGNVIWVFGYNYDLVIDGFTITGGRADGSLEEPPYAGGGIVVHLASPIIRNCWIKDNYATEGGGVWFGSTGQPRLENCIVENNEAMIGGGIALINDAQRMVIAGCLIRNNHAFTAGGGFFDYNALFTMSDCVVTGNSSNSKGGGISLSTLHEDSWLINTTIADNSGVLGAGIRVVGNTFINIEACIVALNHGPAFSTGQGDGVAMGCSVVFGNTGGDHYPNWFIDEGGNFSADPMFCDLSSLALQPGSPCLPGNHPDGADCGLIGGSDKECGSLF